eukprot:382338-Hanusia_phi.AAC.1
MEYMEHDFRALMETMKAPFRTGQVARARDLVDVALTSGSRRRRAEEEEEEEEEEEACEEGIRRFDRPRQALGHPPGPEDFQPRESTCCGFTSLTRSNLAAARQQGMPQGLRFWTCQKGRSLSLLLPPSRRPSFLILNFQYHDPVKAMTPEVVTLWYRAPELLYGEK